MRSFPPSWNKTLTRLGFRRAKTNQRAERRRARIETLERRELLSVSPPHTQIVGDLDGDGVLDVVTAAGGGAWTIATSDGAESWRVFANDGGAVGSNSLPDGFAVGDFNGDGRDDVLGRRGSNWSRFLVDDHTVVANFDAVSRATPLVAGDTAVTWGNLFVGDFNGDGRDDIGTLESGQTLKVAVSTGDGFLDAETFTTLDAPHLATSVQPGDFNGDGRDDLWFVQSEDATNATRTLVTSDGASFNAAPSITGASWHRTVVGDLDGDGADELVGRHDWSTQWRVVQYEDGQTPVIETNWGGNLHVNDPAMVLSTGDANGDGRDDLIMRLANLDYVVGLSRRAPGTTDAFWGGHIGAAVDGWFADHDVPGLMQPGAVVGRQDELVRLFSDVYNNVELELYPGLMKGVEATEQTKAGNPWDQAALLVEKLDAAGFNASIAHVNAQADYRDVARWLGMSAGVTAGQVNDLIELVFSDVAGQNSPDGDLIRWVHAVVKVDVPSPWAMADAHYLDPSWKFRDQREGAPVNLTNATPSYTPDYGRTTRGSFDEFGYLKDAARNELPIEWYAEQVQEYLADVYKDKSVADISREGPILQRAFTRLDQIAVRARPDAQLPDGLTIESEHASYTSAGALPDSLQHRVTVAVEGVVAEEQSTTLGGLISAATPVDGFVVDVASASFAGQFTHSPTPATTQVNGETFIEVRGNQVVAIDLPATYDVTSNTTLRFSYFGTYFYPYGPVPDPLAYESPNVVRKIGFDTGTLYQYPHSTIGSSLYESGDGVQVLTINAGQTVTNATRILFSVETPWNDDPSNHVVRIGDIEFFEGASIGGHTFDPNTGTISQVGSSTVEMEIDVDSQAGAQPYALTKDSYLEFEYKSDSTGALHAIGWDDNLAAGGETHRKLDGNGTRSGYTTTASPVGPAADGYDTYRIHVGSGLTGVQTRDLARVIFTTEDGSNPNAASDFRNLRVVEEAQPGGLYFTETLSVPQHSLDRITIEFEHEDFGTPNPLDDTYRAQLFVGESATPLDSASSTELLRYGDTAKITVTHYQPSALGVSTAPVENDYFREPGEIIAIGLEANQFSREHLAGRIADLNDALLDGADEGDIRELLTYTSDLYWSRFNESAERVESLFDTIGAKQRVGSGIAASKAQLYDLSGVSTDHLQFPILPVDMGVDLPNVSRSSFSRDAFATNPEAFQLLRWHASALEHAVLEEVVNTESVSTVRGLWNAYHNVSEGTVDEVTDVVRVYTATGSGANRVVEYKGALGFGLTQEDPSPDQSHPLRGDANIEYRTFAALGGNRYVYQSTLMNDLNLHDETIRDVVFNRLVNGSDDVTILVPLVKSKIADGWSGSVYLAESPTGATYAIQQIGGQVTNSGGAINGDELRPRPVELPPTTFTNQAWAGDPVAVANGNMFRDEVDFTFANAGLPLDLTRHYDAQSDNDVGLGVGWVHSFTGLLYLDNDNPASNAHDKIVWLRGDGSRHTIEWSSSAGEYELPPSLMGNLVATRNANGTLASFRYYGKDGLDYKFNPINADNTEFGGRLVGRLANVFDRWGREIKINYTSGTSARVANVFARSDEPVTASGQTDTSLDRRIDFQYDDSGSPYVDAIKKVGGDELSRVRYRIGTGFVGEANSNRRLRWADPVGGASLSAHATQYQYYAPTTSDLPSGDRRIGMMMWLEEPGAGETHHYEYYANRRAFRGRTVVDDSVDVDQGGAVDQVFTYDLFRNVAEFTDENGHTTTYHHQDNGLLTKQVHPDGSFLAYGWGAPGANEDLMVSSTNEVGATETFTYYGPTDSVSGTRRFGELHVHTDAVGTQTRYTHYVSSNSSFKHISEVATAVADFGGEHLETVYERDARGALLRTTVVDNGVVVSDSGPTERIFHGSSTARRLRGLPTAQTEPRGLEGDEAVTWQPIFDRVQVTGGELTVRLSADGSATGGSDIYVVADAVRLDRLDGGVLDSRVVDDADPGFTKLVTAGLDRDVVGGSQGQFAGGSKLFHWVAGHDNHAEWDFDDLPDGTYRVSTLWVPWTGRDKTASYEIVSGGASAIGGDTVFVDQELNPTGFQPYVTDYEYDSTGRVTSTITDGVRTMLREYDHHGNVSYEQDAAGVGMRYEYDTLGRLTSQNLTPAGGYKVDFATATITAVPGQDSASGQPAVLDVTPDGRGVALSGNVARAVSIADYTVTPNTVLDFWFRADQLAEIQGLILDTNSLHGGADSAPELTLQLAGRQSFWADYSGTDGFPSYDGRVGDLIHYRIPVGQLASGVAGLNLANIDYLTFFNDNNASTADGTSFFYDVRLSEGDPSTSDHGRVDYTYYADGRLQSEDSVVLASTRQFYDDRGKLTRSLNPDQTFTTFQYDAVGNVIAQTDASGATTRFVYDGRNRVVQTIAADGTSTITRYNGDGSVAATVDPLDHASRTRYDEAGRPIAIESTVAFDGVVDGVALTQFEYDDLGRLTKTTDPNDVVTEIRYNDAGRPETELVYAMSTPSDVISETHTTYDLLGRETATQTIDRTGVADQAVIDWTFQYDALGRAVVVVNPDGTRTRTVHDVDGREVARYDELGRATVSKYDAYGWLEEFVSPDPRDAASRPGTRFERDLAGRVTSEFVLAGSVTDSAAVETEIVTTYDAVGRVASIEEEDPSLGETAVVRRFYDVLGRPIAEVDALGSTNYRQRDQLGRVVGTYASDPDGHGPAVGPATRHTLDAAGRVASTTGPTGLVTDFEYDTLGRLREQTDHFRDGADAAQSATRAFTYDLGGSLVTETDALGRTTTYEHDGLGRVVRATLPTPAGLVAPVTETVYDGFGSVQRVIEKRQGETDRVTEWDHDTRGRVLTERLIDDDGASTTLRTTTFAYDAVGNVVRSVDPTGLVTLSVYDALDRLVEEIVDAEEGRPAQARVFTGVGGSSANVAATLVSGATAVEVDATAGGGHRYLTLGSTYIVRHNTVLEFTLEDRGDLGALRVGFDSNSAFSSAADGPHEQVVFDADGPNTDVVTERLADGRLRVRVPFGQLLAANGGVTYNATELSLYADGGLATLSDVRLYETDAVHTKWTYTPRGDVATSTAASDPRGVRTEYAYDLRGRLATETRDAAQNADPHITWTYDAVGNVATESVRDDAEGAGPATYRTTAYRYDQLHRQTMVIDPDPATGAVAGAGWTPTSDTRPYTEFVYDALGAVVESTNGEGETARTEYDELGRVLAEYDGESDGQSHKTAYSYYDDGTLHTLTDAVGNTTTFEYDALGRLTKETNQPGDERLTAYDAWGDVASVTDRDGLTRSFDYDRLGRVEAEYWDAAPTPQLTWQYDDADRVTAQTDGLQSQTFRYDSLGRLIEQDDSRTDETDTLRHTYTYTYEYDAVAGQWNDQVLRTQQLLDNGAFSTYISATYSHYDSQGRLANIEDNDGPLPDAFVIDDKNVAFNYNADGALREIVRSSDSNAGVWGTVLPTEYTYDGAGRLQQIAHDPGPTPLRTLDYHYDRASRISAIDSAYGVGYDAGAPVNTRSFGYDDSGQITDDDGLAIQYDENGNRLSAGGDLLTVGDANRTNSDAEYDYEYNKEGARTKRTHRATGQVTTYEWDHRGRLTAVRTSVEANPQTLDFNTLTPTGVLGRDSSSSTATVDQNGDRVHLQGNAWKAYEVNYNVTADTVLAFTFEAPVKGIIQGVALDSDTPPQLGATTGETRIQLFGDGFGWERYGDYQAGDGVVDYVIPLSELNGFTTGVRKWLALYNHNGSSGLGGHSYFSNVRLYEAAVEETTYAYNADDRLVEEATPTETLRHAYEGGERVITTRPEASGPPELVNRYQYGPTRDQALWDEAFEQIGGAQLGEARWLLGDHQNTVGDVVDEGGVLRKSLEYDAFGRVTRVVDYDASGAAIGGRLDFATAAVSSHSQDGLNGPSVSTPVEGGRGVEVSGDVWKAYAFDYTVTPETVLRFRYRSDAEGLVHALILDANTNQNGYDEERFQLSGKSAWWTEYGDWMSVYDDREGSWVEYTIPIGALPTFTLTDVNYLRLIVEQKAGHAAGSATVRDVWLYEADAGGAPLGAIETVVGYTGKPWDAGSATWVHEARRYDPEIGEFTKEDPSGFGAGDANLYRYVTNGAVNYVDPSGLTQTGNPLDTLAGGASSGVGGVSTFNGPGLLAPVTTPSASSFGVTTRFENFATPSVAAPLVDLATAPIVSLGGQQRRVAFLGDDANRTLSQRNALVADLNGSPTFEAINDFVTFDGRAVERFTQRASTARIRQLPTIAAEPSTFDLALEPIGGKVFNVGVRVAAPYARYFASAGLDATGRALGGASGTLGATLNTLRNTGSQFIDTAGRVRVDVDFRPLTQVRLNSGAPLDLLPKVSLRVVPASVAPTQQTRLALPAPSAQRLPQDIRVSPTAPAPLALNRPISGSAAQQRALQADIRRAIAEGATDIRVNQQQVNAAGRRVGINRPDLQYNRADGVRVNIEYDNATRGSFPNTPRGPAHARRIQANDPSSVIELRRFP